MPSLSKLPSNISQRQLTKVLERLGFEINTKGGKGSHIKAVWSATGKSIIIQGDLRKDVLYSLIKQIQETASVTWKQIKKEL